ncbi:MAG: hypothetical protein HeimC3_42840 [Candidatus Heimdallarchaeota archaeon LC_3]|nr:MAG: hypothetical protein HeimC3_42840 [Candidatus Heimdallarchaeota archaeon LC_3]
MNKTNIVNEKKILKEVQKSYCVLHTKRRAYRLCDNCYLPYCKEDIVESWSHNFLSYAYLGSKKEFKKQSLCKSCERRKRRNSVGFAVFLLIVFGIFILGFAFNP